MDERFRAVHDERFPRRSIKDIRAERLRAMGYLPIEEFDRQQTLTEGMRMDQNKDTWQSGHEVGALLATLRGSDLDTIAELKDMPLPELAAFGQRLHRLQRTLTVVAVAKARDIPLSRVRI